MGRGRCWGCLFECMLIHLVFPEHLLCAEVTEGSETSLWQRTGKRLTLIPHRGLLPESMSPGHQDQGPLVFISQASPGASSSQENRRTPAPVIISRSASFRSCRPVYLLGLWEQHAGGGIFHLDLERWVGLSLSVVVGGAVRLRRSLLEDHDYDWRPSVEPQGCVSLFHPRDCLPQGPPTLLPEMRKSGARILWKEFCVSNAWALALWLAPSCGLSFPEMVCFWWMSAQGFGPACHGCLTIFTSWHGWAVGFTQTLCSLITEERVFPLCV